MKHVDILDNNNENNIKNAFSRYKSIFGPDLKRHVLLNRTIYFHDVFPTDSLYLVLIVDRGEKKENLGFLLDREIPQFLNDYDLDENQDALHLKFIKKRGT